MPGRRGPFAALASLLAVIAGPACSPRERPVVAPMASAPSPPAWRAGERSQGAALRSVRDHSPLGARITVLGTAFVHAAQRHGRERIEFVFLEVDRRGRARLGHAVAITQDRGRRLVSLYCAYRTASPADAIMIAGESASPPSPS